MQVVDKVSESKEGPWPAQIVSLIEREVLVVLHVVDVNPLSVDGYLVVDVSLQRLYHVF
jgi:hypothetical protein